MKILKRSLLSFKLDRHVSASTATVVSETDNQVRRQNSLEQMSSLKVPVPTEHSGDERCSVSSGMLISFCCLMSIYSCYFQHLSLFLSPDLTLFCSCFLILADDQMKCFQLSKLSNSSAKSLMLNNHIYDNIFRGT